MPKIERVIPVLTYADIQVDDVDAHYERARSAGAHFDSAPSDQPYGQREYGARDPEGHRWWFMMPLDTQR